MGFDAESTTEDVLAGVDLRGWRVLVTGVSAGLGVETARALASKGAQVIGAVRDLPKAETAMAQVRPETGSDGSIDLVALDLASLASVRACADLLIAQAKPFDLIIANAGIMACPYGLTADGFELQFGTNHLGHFVLINRLAALMKPVSRVVSLASSGHLYADVDLEDPNFAHTEYSPLTAYGRAKTANILFAVELDRRRKADGVRATAVHPGGIQTQLSRHFDPGMEQAIFDEINTAKLARGEPPLRWKSIAQGAATSVWAGIVADAAEIGGRYCEDCQMTQHPSSVAPYALDPDRARAVWRKSEEMVGERFA